MIISKTRFLIYICISISIMISVSCSPQRKYEILSFFFDGVPNPNIDSNLVVNKSIDSSLVLNVKKKKTKKPKITMVMHPPYKDRDCESCHNFDEGNKLVEKQPDLCYQCHDNMGDTFSYLHGPVASGFCTKCHNPHTSKNKALLIRKGQKVCFFCHNRKNVLKNDVHEDIDNTNCWECHDPHGGSDRFLLK